MLLFLPVSLGDVHRILLHGHLTLIGHLTSSLLKSLLIQTVAGILNGYYVDFQEYLDVLQQFVRQHNVFCVRMEIYEHFAGTLLVENVETRYVVTDALLIVDPEKRIVPRLSLCVQQSIQIRNLNVR